MHAGITLICFSRGDRFTIYTHAERIIGVPDRVIHKIIACGRT